MTGSTLVVFGNSAWFGSDTHLWTTADGAHWVRYPFSCPPPVYGERYALWSISAASPAHVTFLCAVLTGMFHNQMKVLVSFNGGRTERQAPSAPPTGGDTFGFAVAPGRFGVITIAVVTPGPDFIYRSANLGKTWTTVRVPGTGGGIMLTSLQFMSGTAGCLVLSGNGVYSALMWTANAGRVWYPVKF
jgi:hypothetical protein